MRVEGERASRTSWLDDLAERTTLLWLAWVGGVCLTMLCAVDFKSWRTSGSSGWSDGGTAWVVWGFLGSAAVLALLLVALVADFGWIERVTNPTGIVRATLAASITVSALTGYYAWNHRRHIEETLPEGWTFHASFGLRSGPWVAGGTAALAAVLLAIQVFEAKRSH